MNVVFLNNDDLITNLQAIATACEQQQSIIFDTKFINTCDSDLVLFLCTGDRPPVIGRWDVEGGVAPGPILQVSCTNL